MKFLLKKTNFIMNKIDLLLQYYEINQSSGFFRGFLFCLYKILHNISRYIFEFSVMAIL